MTAPRISAALRQAVIERAGWRCELTPFFNPRAQHWPDHFRLDGARIVPLTPEARVTITILQLNHPDRLIERERLMQAGKYP